MANELKPCPNCKSTNLRKVRILSRRFPYWYWIECFNCHYCGAVRMFLRRAIKAWNRGATDAE